MAYIYSVDSEDASWHFPAVIMAVILQVIMPLLLLLWTGALGLFLVLISGVLTFREVLIEKAAWNTLVWFSTLVMMAILLGKFGVTQFLAEALGEFTSAMGLGEISIMVFLSFTFLYTRYFFASTTVLDLFSRKFRILLIISRN